jgi:hypothetical protein
MGFFAGFLQFIINFAGRISEAAMGGAGLRGTLYFSRSYFSRFFFFLLFAGRISAAGAIEWVRWAGDIILFRVYAV